jgi:hypothetical protein
MHNRFFAKLNLVRELAPKSKSTREIGVAIILVGNGVALLIGLLLQSLLGIVLILGTAAFDVYWFYWSSKHKRRQRYPLVPPEGKGDVYLPRTDIPRPIHQDLRLMDEKKKTFAKIDRWRRKRGRKRD